jgi:hypothetical protein
MPDRVAPQRPGPEPERLKIDGDWEQAVERALKKPRPADGWPKPQQKKKRPAAKKPRGK